MLAESPGTIALPTSEIGRFAMFTVALAGTIQPPDTHLVVMASASVTENINAVIRQLRPEDRWCFIVGDDHTWLPDALMKLLEALDDNLDADIIVPLVTKRNPPWYPVIFHEAGEKDGLPMWKPFGWEEIPDHGMFEVDAAGSAGMLIRREVLDAFGDGPWFRSTGGVFLNEDVTFCADARALGFRVFACADVSMGHIGLFNVRPARRNGRWGALTEFSSPEEQFRHLFMPDAEDHQAAVSGR